MAPDVTCVMPVNGCSRGYDGQLCEENVVVCRNMSFGFFFKHLKNQPMPGKCTLGKIPALPSRVSIHSQGNDNIHPL